MVTYPPRRESKHARKVREMQEQRVASCAAARQGKFTSNKVSESYTRVPGSSNLRKR